jgi:hypothetical protein
MAALLEDLDRSLARLQHVVRTVDPASVSGDEAQALVARFCDAERVGASGVALFSPVVLETGVFAKGGHASAPDWLGAVSGTSAGVANRRLAARTAAAADPVLTEALHEGELSSDQLKVVTETSRQVPESSSALLGLIGEGASHQELTTAARSLKATAQSRETERLRRARVHAQRHLRWHQDDHGGIRAELFCDEVQWARVMPTLEAEAKRRWKRAGTGPDAESLAAHRLDALIDLLAGWRAQNKATGTSSRPPAPRAIVIISAESLRRGTTEHGETCEIDGIGPVSVAAAIELIGHSALHYVIKEGFDIKTVTKSTRDVGICLEVALLVRDRTCAAPGCGKAFGLEIDHRAVDFGNDGATTLDNLVRLCPAHHALKTYGACKVEGAAGQWSWRNPERPKSAGYVTRARRLAAAKAKAKKHYGWGAESPGSPGSPEDRNHPQQQ